MKKLILWIDTIQIGLVISEIILILVQLYVSFIAHNRDLGMKVSVFVIVLGIINIVFGLCNKKFLRAFSNCAKHLEIVDNIVQVTAYNYYYAKKYHMRFDTERIKKELDQDELQLVYVPEMFDEEPASDDEILESITFMKEWNIDVMHRVLSMSLAKGFITGPQRKILLERGLSCINNINDKSFTAKKRADDLYDVRYNFNTENGVRYS